MFVLTFIHAHRRARAIKGMIKKFAYRLSPSTSVDPIG